MTLKSWEWAGNGKSQQAVEKVDKQRNCHSERSEESRFS
jgi:hypothetical protein